MRMNVPGRQGASLRGFGGRSGGFTLLEVIIVIVIILAIMSIVAVNLMGTRDKGLKGTVEIQLKSFKNALSHFNLEFNRYPTDDEGLAVLWDSSKLEGEADKAKWTKLIDEPKPLDAWGTAWGYKQVGEHAPSGMYDLWSFGPDKQDGTEDDIHLWKTVEGEGGGGSGTSGGTDSGATKPK